MPCLIFSVCKVKKSFILIIRIESNPKAHLPNRGMVSRHSTGFSLLWPGTRDGTLSMWVECVTCCRGAEFFHGPQRDACLTFPRVYSAHRVSSQSFPLSGPMEGASQHVEIAASFAFTEPARPSLRIASWLVCPEFPAAVAARDEFR